jgi:hypothetical protein
VVLLDTVNLNPAAGKTTPQDTAAMAALTAVIESDPLATSGRGGGAGTRRVWDAGALYHLWVSCAEGGGEGMPPASRSHRVAVAVAAG